MDEQTKKNLIEELIHNGIIAKITASLLILIIAVELITSINDSHDSRMIILPVITGIIGSAMTFLFVKKDGKKN